MRILVTNDDGIDADGIKILAEELAHTAEITVVAPDKERSAAGHGVTFFSPLRVNKISQNASVAFYSCSGTPADCIIVGLTHIMKENLPDLVVTGINRGPNLGDDFHYSGTISSAVEGALAGIPSIAVSTGVTKDFKVPCYRNTAKIAAALASMVFEKKIPGRAMINLNVPTDEIKGVRITHLGFSNFSYEVIERKDGLNLDYFWLSRKSNFKNDKYEGSDYQALADGYVSITPLNLDMTRNAAEADFMDGWNIEEIMNAVRQKAS